MAQSKPTTPSITSTKGKVHTNKPVNAQNVVRACKTTSRIDDGRDNTLYPVILMDITDEGKQYWFYAVGDEATRDADYTSLDNDINT